MTGRRLSDWTPRPGPGRQILHGRTVRLVPIEDEAPLGALWQAFSADPEGAIWRYLPYGPFPDEAAFRQAAARLHATDGLFFHAFVPERSSRAEGVAALMRIDEANGVGEIGHVCFSPRLQGTVEATEGLFLLMDRLLGQLGYRRLEWKCNAANAASRRAAERLGFTFEGIFRQHLVVKGENRDTAWFSVIDGEWPALRARFERWLDPSNFDGEGRQIKALRAI
ncbi:GNAT family N-acetyltransferase [Antarcticirhabdus aurantiaca]|uniref:GNAT family protein n=1 Tax=Antarcticirhabdus aurantiaca TaxID=2606717 RepID=A0ACD4NTZ3_9HYPH|nr:GNAT family protein [Antarcticirhabdus aurantiaca]WAJ30243.1 GNAT family protein [Jeongeuplla avenae]